MSHWEAAGKSNDWYTPKWIFDALGCEFATDVAAARVRKFSHVPASWFIVDNGLTAPWQGFVWMNPVETGEAMEKSHFSGGRERSDRVAETKSDLKGVRVEIARA